MAPGVLKSRQTWHRAIDPTGSFGNQNVAYQPLPQLQSRITSLTHYSSPVNGY